MKPTSIRLDPDTLAALDDEAAARDMSRTQRIQQVIARRDHYDDLQRDYEQLQADYERLQEEHARVESALQDANAAREDAQAERDALEAELQETKNELSRQERKNNRLNNKLVAANSRHDDVEELVEYVSEEKALQREQRIRERTREEAPIWVRWRWAIFGRDG